MRTLGSQPFELLSPTGRRVRGEPALDAADRPAVSFDPILRQPTDDSVFGAIRGDGQSQAGPAAHGENGPGSVVSQTADYHRSAGREGLSLLASRPGTDPRRRGLEFGHHLRSDQAWVHVSDRGYRLVQSVRALVAAFQHL